MSLDNNDLHYCYLFKYKVYVRVYKSYSALQLVNNVQSINYIKHNYDNN